MRAPEPYNLLEPEFEKVIRRTVRRGTIQVHLDCRRQQSPQDFQINAAALTSYTMQLRRLAEDLKLRDRGESLLAQVLALPGVVPEPGAGLFSLEDDWPVVERVLEEALGRLQTMRQEEGRAMAQELLQLRDHVGQHLERIRQQRRPSPKDSAIDCWNVSAPCSANWMCRLIVAILSRKFPYSRSAATSPRR